MKANEMKYNILIEYNKIADLTAPGYDDRELAYVANSAQDRVYKHLMNPKSNKLNAGFEYDEQRRRDLVEIVNVVHIFGYNVNTNSNLVSDTLKYSFDIEKDEAGLYKRLVINQIQDSADNDVYTAATTPGEVLKDSIGFVRGLCQGLNIKFTQTISFTNASNLISSTLSNGLLNGDAVTFSSSDSDLPEGLSEDVTYYVIDRVDDSTTSTFTFKVSLERDGTEVAFTDDGTGSMLVTNTATIRNILSDNTIEVSRKLDNVESTFTGGLATSVNQYGKHQNGLVFDLPPLFLYNIEEKNVTSREKTVHSTIKPITHNYFDANIRNPYKQPYKNTTWRMDIGSSVKGWGSEDGTMSMVTDEYDNTTSFINSKSSYKRAELITSGGKILDYYVRYIKYPRRIVFDEDTIANQVSCELDESLHGMIVSEAVKILTSITNPQEYQIKAAEAQSAE